MNIGKFRICQEEVLFLEIFDESFRTAKATKPTENPTKPIKEIILPTKELLEVTVVAETSFPSLIAALPPFPLFFPLELGCLGPRSGGLGLVPDGLVGAGPVTTTVPEPISICLFLASSKTWKV
jgi:hypothetical protein